jgi:hypothetical protein
MEAALEDWLTVKLVILCVDSVVCIFGDLPMSGEAPRSFSLQLKKNHHHHLDGTFYIQRVVLSVLYKTVHLMLKRLWKVGVIVVLNYSWFE